MTSGSKRAAAIVLAVAALVLVASIVLALARVGFVRTWIYDLAWWSWIAIASSAAHLRGGRTALFDRPRAFVLLAIHSAAFWLFFELLNLRTHTWYYVGVPASGVERWIGIFVSFATVLPGVIATRDLLASFGLFARARVRPWRAGPIACAASVALGLASLAMSLAYPAVFHPLAWGAVVLLFEPLLLALGREGLLTSLARGDARPACLLLAAGLVTGGLWEAWNSLSSARWIYTVPGLDELKLFEMPLLGFLGFPPFALECWTYVRLLVALGILPELEAESPREGIRGREIAGAILALGFCAPSIALVDRLTVLAREPLVREIRDLATNEVAALERAGVEYAGDLARLEPADLAALAGVEPSRGARALERARLMACKGLGARGAAWLAGARVDSIAALAAAEPAELRARILDVHAGPPPAPSLAEVKVWVLGARSLAR